MSSGFTRDLRAAFEETLYREQRVPLTRYTESDDLDPITTSDASTCLIIASDEGHPKKMYVGRDRAR